MFEVCEKVCFCVWFFKLIPLIWRGPLQAVVMAGWVVLVGRFVSDPAGAVVHSPAHSDAQ